MSLTVSLLGTGSMGAAMASRVLTGGQGLTVWNRSPGRTEPLRAQGAIVATTPAAATADSDVTVLMLTGAAAITEVLMAPGGAVEGLVAGALVVNASTIGPDDSRVVADLLANRGIRYVEAPVCGSVDRAAAGTLDVFLGGADADVARARPVVEYWSTPDRVRHVGRIGAASGAKLVRNLTLGLAIVGVGEALRLADALGLPVDVAHQAVEVGPLAASVSGIRALGSRAPVAFTVDLLLKDLALCLDAGRRELPMTAVAHSAAERIARAGFGAADSRVLALQVGAGR